MLSPDKEERIYDDRGNLIYHKTSYGYEAWMEYNENNRMTHYKDNSSEDNYIFNEYDNLVYHKCIRYNDIYEEWFGYDHRGYNDYYKNSNGFEEWIGYDDDMNRIYYKNSLGLERNL